MDVLKERLDAYISNTSRIRTLSSPDPAKLDSGAAYSETLRNNFIQIGKIAKENRAILSDTLVPLLSAQEPPGTDTIEELNRFSEMLLNASNVESLDIPLSYMVSVRLFDYAMRGEDTGLKLRQADYVISSAYAMINLAKRLGFGADACTPFRKEGFRAAAYIQKFCSKEALAKLENEALRELVLINSRFMVCLYEGSSADASVCRENLDMLEWSSAMGDDEEIRRLVPRYDWRYHRFRVMEYAGAISEHNNRRGCSLALRRRISDICSRMLQVWDSDPGYYRNISPRIYARLMAVRNKYLCGCTDREAYLDQLEKLYEDYERARATFRAAEEVHYIIGIPLEYIYALERPSGFVTEQNDYAADGPSEPLTPKQIRTLTRFYHVIEERALYTIGTRSLTYLLEFLSMLLRHFIEVPKVSFMRFCLSTMRALHPPTYVHTLMVGEISRYLCHAMIEEAPDILAGTLMLKSAEDIRQNKEDVLSFIEQAALCHDFGKIPLIDIIFVYGRRLFDFEFDLIREHPDLGWNMLSRIPSLKKYTDIVRGHHKWFDNSSGYPDAFSMEESALEPLIDIVTCADCMDAATDSVGRSYSRGKTLDEYIAEIEDGSGSRYASFLPGLLKNPAVHAQLEKILKDRREHFYRITYDKLIEKHRAEETV